EVRIAVALAQEIDRRLAVGDRVVRVRIVLASGPAVDAVAQALEVEAQAREAERRERAGELDVEPVGADVMRGARVEDDDRGAGGRIVRPRENAEQMAVRAEATGALLEPGLGPALRAEGKLDRFTRAVLHGRGHGQRRPR